MDETQTHVLPYPKKGGFVIYFDEFRDVLTVLTDEEKGRLFQALFDYFDTGAEPAAFDNRLLEAEYRRLKLNILKSGLRYAELCEKRAEAGRKAKARKKGKSKSKQTEAKEGITNTNTNTNMNTNTEMNTNPETDPPPGVNTVCVEKHTHKNLYGRYRNVSLSGEELDELKRSFPEHWNGLVEELSAAMYAKNLSYPDHLATLYNWAARHDFAVNADPARSGLTDAEQKLRLHPELRPQYAALDMMRDPEHPEKLIPKPEAVEREQARIAAAEEKLAAKEAEQA